MSTADLTARIEHLVRTPGLADNDQQLATAMLSIVDRMMDRFLSHAAADRSDLLLRTLEAGGKALLVSLIRDYKDSLLTAAQVKMEFNVATPTLHRKKSEGTVIGFSMGESRAVFFPKEQFLDVVRKEFPDLAQTIIARVGNGYPAFHAMYVPRDSLGGLCLAKVLQKGSDPQSLEQIRDVLRGFRENDFG